MIAGKGRRRILRMPWAALLMVVLLRSLVPQGYMVAVVDGRLAVTLCDGQASTAGTPATHAHHHHEGMAAGAMAAGAGMPAHAGDPGDPASQHSHPPCLFAATALSTPPQAAPLPIPSYTQVVAVDDWLPTARTSGTIERAQSPRAPPALA